jgi:serine/threonine protein phosphatase 1
MIKHFEKNTAGRDFCVGDIHGHFTRLQSALDAAGFDPVVDRLFSVGDLVDRGPESEESFEWVMQKPWFHAVQGNHEDMTITSCRDGDTGNAAGHHYINGGAWFYGIPKSEQECYAGMLNDLPIAIEVETEFGLVGIVHADVPRKDWRRFCDDVKAGGPESDHLRAMCQWSRKRIGDGDETGVTGVHAVIVGHTPVRKPVILGNVYHIDTGGWLPDGSGYFTLINLATLETIPPMPQKIDWK